MFRKIFDFGAGLFMLAIGLWAMLALAGFISAIVITICAILS